MRIELVKDYDGMNIVASIVRYRDIDENFIKQWAGLESRAKNANAFLSPNFIIPAVKHLTPGMKPLFLVVNKKVGNVYTMIGMGVFVFSLGTIKFPLPHLKAYRTPHSYLGGLLIDDSYMKIFLDAIFDYLNSTRYLFGIEIVDQSMDTEFEKHMESSCVNNDMEWFMENSKQRAILIPKKVGEEYIRTNYSKNRLKALKRKYNHLLKYGEVRWDIVVGSQVDGVVIDRFLKLENMGWKGKGGTSLLSKPGNEKFFREMIGNFSREERVYFTELSVNGQVISSTSNLMSSQAGFAFKIGWDSNYAQAGPGILNEFEFIKNVERLFHDLEYIDSGAGEGSYMDELWPDRIRLVSGIYASKCFAKPMMKVVNLARRLKKSLPAFA